MGILFLFLMPMAPRASEQHGGRSEAASGRVEGTQLITITTKVISTASSKRLLGTMELLFDVRTEAFHYHSIEY